MVSLVVKLRLNKTQEDTCVKWIDSLTGVWNWAIRKIELDAKDGFYYSEFDVMKWTSFVSTTLAIPAHTLSAMTAQAWQAWDRCFKKLMKKPRLKGDRRKLSYVPFPDPIKNPVGNRLKLPFLGSVKFHKQDIPKGRIKCGRIVRRASGWYLCLFIDTMREPIKRKSTGTIGIDPGFKSLLTLSNGTQISHPRELEASAKRLSQAQRGKNKKLTARIHERTANQKKDRNHKLSLDLVRNYTQIYFSKDNVSRMKGMFGKSVSSSNHYQLRQMLKYKSLAGGTSYTEVNSKFSTRTCSTCRSLTGPAGLAGLKVRHWECTSCGAMHDRDVNAAINTLNVGAGTAHEAVV